MKKYVRLAVSAVVMALALVLCAPVGDALNDMAERPLLDWRIPFHLIAMIAGLIAGATVCSIIFGKLSPKTGHGKTMYSLIGSATRYIFFLVGLLWSLAIMGVDVNALLAGAGVVALIIGFGAESLISDVITGIFMIFENQYRVGDIIVVDDFRGAVTHIGIRTTSITDAGGNVKIINNSDIRNLINRSTSNSVAVCDLGVLYNGESVRQGEAVLANAIDRLYAEKRELFKSCPKYLGVQELSLSENAAILRVVADVEEENIYAAQRAMNRDLMMALEDAGVGNPPTELAVTHVNLGDRR